MVHVHPAEITALQERASRAELECQRLREVISGLSGEKYRLMRDVDRLRCLTVALDGELQILRGRGC